MLCACYRKDEAVNPEFYAAAVGAVLSEYPRDVVEYVTDPRTGIPSKCQWLPSVKEVKDACEVAHQTLINADLRKRELELQFAERAKYEAEQAEKAHHPTRAEIEAKLGRSITDRR